MTICIKSVLFLAGRRWLIKQTSIEVIDYELLFGTCTLGKLHKFDISHMNVLIKIKQDNIMKHFVYMPLEKHRCMFLRSKDHLDDLQT